MSMLGITLRRSEQKAVEQFAAIHNLTMGEAIRFAFNQARNERMSPARGPKDSAKVTPIRG